LPAPVPFPDPVLDPPVAFGNAATLRHGEEVYGRFCSTCHGRDGLSRGMFPDLRYSPALASSAAFGQIVLEGVRAHNGMVSFAKALKADDVEAIRAYVVDRAQAAKAGAAAPAVPASAPQPHGE